MTKQCSSFFFPFIFFSSRSRSSSPNFDVPARVLVPFYIHERRSRIVHKKVNGVHERRSCSSTPGNLVFYNLQMMVNQTFAHVNRGALSKREQFLHKTPDLVNAVHFLRTIVWTAFITTERNVNANGNGQICRTRTGTGGKNWMNEAMNELLHFVAHWCNCQLYMPTFVVLVHFKMFWCNQNCFIASFAMIDWT